MFNKYPRGVDSDEQKHCLVISNEGITIFDVLENTTIMSNHGHQRSMQDKYEVKCLSSVRTIGATPCITSIICPLDMSMWSYNYIQLMMVIFLCCIKR